MCSQVSVQSPSGRYVVKLAILLVFCCFAETAAGSCIRYGQSCWGAHGKRSHHENVKNNGNIVKNELLNEDARWFIAKLLQTNENRLRDQMEDSQPDDFKISDESSNILTDPEQVNPVNDLFTDKLRLIKYLKSMEKAT